VDPGVADSLAAATVQVYCGNVRGSGFHFVKPDVIATASHVVEHDPDNVSAETEDGHVWQEIVLVAQSPSDQHDFALLRIDEEVGGDRVSLMPGKSPAVGDRGREIAFAGFPHGLEDLLVQRAVVAGFSGDDFYLDGSVNGGNSGGPVVDAENGQVVGVITASRFLFSEDLEQLARAARAIAAQAQRVRARGGGMHQIDLGGMVIEGMSMGQGPAIGGIEFDALAALVSQSNQLLELAFDANANTGLGLAVNIELVVEKCREHGIVSV
jgi:Trypsin-like peptidase domain